MGYRDLISRERKAPGAGELRLSRRLAALHLGGILLLVLVVFGSVAWIAREFDKLAVELSQSQVRSAITSFRARLNGTVRDYSAWDAAYEAVLAGDRDWLYRNVGTAVSEVGNLDLIVFVVPGSRPFGWRAGSPAAGEADLLPTALLNAVVGLLDADTAGGPSHTLIARYDGAPWAFSVAQVGPAGVAPADLPLQVHGRKLSETRLARIAGNALVDGLALAEAPRDGQAAIPLTDYNGTIIRYVVWDAPRPGIGILRQVAPPLGLTLLFVIVVSTACSRYLVRSARRLERALQAARTADQSKTEFLSNVSHELRTPMNGILGVAQLLDTTELDDEQRELVKVLFASANTQMSLISDLLDLGRLDCGNRQLVEEPFEPARVLQGLSEMMRVAAAEKAIRLDADWEALAGLTVRGDERAFSQIVTNLLGNAVKFTDEGGVELSAGADRDGDRVGVSVRVGDTGRGIPAEALPHVFERFYQVGTTSRRTEGTGLGLAISQNLARMMGGRIEAASVPGIGSTFTLSVAFEVVSGAEARDAA